MREKRLQIHLVLPNDLYDRITADGSVVVTLAPADVLLTDDDEVLAYFTHNFGATPELPHVTCADEICDYFSRR